MGKHKKKHKSKSKKHKSSHYKSSSDENSSSEEEWVEMASTSITQTVEKEKPLVTQEHDNWMSNPALFACISREEMRQSKDKKKDKREEDKYMLDKLGQTERELNPYWKDGGSGLPSECPVTVDSLRQASVTVGDQGAAWLRKALQRAKEQAADKRCSLEEVVAERWGSLEKLENMIAEAEEREKSTPTSKYNQDERYKYNHHDGNKDTFHDRKSKKKKEIHKTEAENKHERDSRSKNKFSKPVDSNDDSSDDKQIKYDKYNKSSERRFVRPSYSSSSDDENRSRKHDRNRYKHHESKTKDSNKFSKPLNSSSEDERSKYTEDRNRGDCPTKLDNTRSHNNYSYSSSSRGWRKKTELQVKEDKSKYDQISESKSHKQPETKVLTEDCNNDEEPVLTDKEMNELGAKLVKAELLGNQDLVDELKLKLEKARKTKANKPKEEVSEEVVILTHTDSRGFTRPVSLGVPEPLGGRRKAKKVETHSGGKRMRYFADDDKYSLQEMFQREKLNTVEDSNEVFAKLASKGIGRDDSIRDMEDVFEETARMEEAEGRKQAKDRQKAIEQSKRTARSLDNCQWCLESQKMLKHLIIAIGRTCYLCVPPFQSLTENHCLIVPSYHTPCATQLDEDVWREIQDFRRSVVQMFLSQDEDVVFFESARHLNRFPHMVLNCVPMPKETGDLAPIYFKKAIQECEMEWSNNKKLVDLKGKDVRRAVPKGLPYFSVDFGMENGFAHVIEDEQLFPQNFAQEIIGGMLDLDHTIWRKQRKQTFEEQSKKVIQLGKLWSPYDITKNS